MSFRIRRLKIYQQLLILFFAAVLLPLFISTLIVTNVNQHAVRAELQYSAIITSDSVYQRLQKSIHEKKLALLFIAKSIEYINDEQRITTFLNEISDATGSITSLDLTDGDENINKANAAEFFKNSDVAIFPKPENDAILMYVMSSTGKFLKKQINIQSLKEELFKYLVNDKRQVYILDSNNKIIISYNDEKKHFDALVKQFPKHYNIEEPKIFGKIKNMPNVFLKISEPDWTIVIATPKELINYGIINARYKIINATVVAAAAIIIIGLLYTYSLNANFKQLFKAISAVAAGNYRRKARLIKDFFTPYEFAYLIEKFNIMAQKIDESYNELQKANMELSKLDKLKSTLIDTISHEFRTPLTSIKGYTSRLLRNDINIDEETRKKSLKVIKQQAERFSRLVDDLLVVPEIESEFLRVFPEETNFNDILKDCILSVQHKQTRKIELKPDEGLPAVYADPDRLTQVIINLLDNAIKYSPENSTINIHVTQENPDNVQISIKNECELISDDQLEKLFDKFTRLENDLKRTTRGTGLGLFIVKGLINAMGGVVELSADDGFEVRFTLPLAK